MFLKDKFFKYGLAIIMVLIIIYLFGKVEFFLDPFKKFIAVLFFPILLAGVLYYLMRPLVRLAVKYRIPRTPAILVIFAAVILLFILVSNYAGSIVNKQLNQLKNDLPGILDATNAKINELINNKDLPFVFTDKMEQQLTSSIEKALPIVSDSIIGLISAAANVTIILITVPFILFYLLKDDNSFYRMFVNAFPKRYRHEGEEILEDVDKTLSTYIIGQGMLAVILGILMYIGYLTIGLKYSLILAIFAMITSFIPMFGSAIGIVPAVLVSLSYNPVMALKVLIIMVIVQQLEGNLISPQLVGKRLDIHPLTLIILFLVAGSLYGFVGMLVAVPAYAVLRVIFTNAVRIFREIKA